MWILAWLACTGGDNTPTWTADVSPIVVGRCANCHAEGGVAPFALATYADAAPRAAAIAAAATAGTMPPWPAGAGSVALHHDPTLTAAQIDTLVAWAEGGAPEGDPADQVAPLPAVGSSLSRVDRTLVMPEPYAPVGDPDDYRCFILPWDGTEEEFVTGFNAVPGDPTVVHHVAAFLFPPDTLLGEGVFDTLAGWDAADPGPGYGCFGGPSRTGESLEVPITQLAQWVPGNQGSDFPEGTGIRVKPGSQIVLQLHYNVQTPGAVDQTALDLKIDPTVARAAAFAPWLDALWPLGNLLIPAGNPSVTYSAKGDPAGLWSFLLGDEPDLSAGFDIHSALLHQHVFGRSSRISVRRASGEEVVLVDIPDYDFNWQITYSFDPVAFAPGDTLELTCTYDNSAAHQPDDRTPADVNWGEGTSDEMCVANLYVSER